MTDASILPNSLHVTIPSLPFQNALQDWSRGDPSKSAQETPLDSIALPENDVRIRFHQRFIRLRANAPLDDVVKNPCVDCEIDHISISR